MILPAGQSDIDLDRSSHHSISDSVIIAQPNLTVIPTTPPKKPTYNTVLSPSNSQYDQDDIRSSIFACPSSQSSIENLPYNYQSHPPISPIHTPQIQVCPSLPSPPKSPIISQNQIRPRISRIPTHVVIKSVHSDQICSPTHSPIKLTEKDNINVHVSPQSTSTQPTPVITKPIKKTANRTKPVLYDMVKETVNNEIK